jgi:hypothetical protein
MAHGYQGEGGRGRRGERKPCRRQIGVLTVRWGDNYLSGRLARRSSVARRSTLAPRARGRRERERQREREREREGEREGEQSRSPGLLIAGCHGHAVTGTTVDEGLPRRSRRESAAEFLLSTEKSVSPMDVRRDSSEGEEEARGSGGQRGPR